MAITNSCDRAGTIANELPLTEQIPVSIQLSKPGKAFSTLNMFAGSSQAGSYDSHDEALDGHERERVMLGLEQPNRNIFPSCT